MLSFGVTGSFVIQITYGRFIVAQFKTCNISSFNNCRYNVMLVKRFKVICSLQELFAGVNVSKGCLYEG